MFKDDTDHLSYFRDISTFGGCTAGPAAAIENMKIIEEEDLLGNSAAMGDHLMGNLAELMDKHKWIGDIRGMGLFAGAELVKDRETKEPMDEKLVAAIVGDCMAQGIIIGATNRSLPGYNNTLLFAPALIATKDDLDQVTSAVDQAITRVLG
jgi:taurine-pyruvate aminotransferase